MSENRDGNGGNDRKVVELGGALPPGTNPRTTHLSVFLTVDSNGNEGIAMFYNEQAQAWVPLVSQSQDQLELLRPAAQVIANNMRVKLTLARFGVREDLEVIDGTLSAVVPDDLRRGERKDNV